MSEESKIEPREKYWIKAGVDVAHREHPNRKMIVDEVLKKTEEIIEDGKKVQKTFVVGVSCHWFDKNERYDSGRFLTMELEPFGRKQKRSDPGSFPKEIPTAVRS